ncbi:MAG TPA: phosphate ABC transporter ATP-binding protein [Anaerolineaceae bacterium]|nr:phosphate ABC transporter ATP-binding protein [Anaerolineaceae bacterium]
MAITYSLQDIQKSYAGRVVLEIDHLHIHPGEILAIVGPSGAGKSTLLRLLNFLEYPDRGSLIYNGQTVTPAVPTPIRREVTTVFQRPALLQDSVENNIRYGLRLRGQRNNTDDINAVLKRMGLETLRRSPARTLSGGEAQRVALARALVLNPAVMLLDEPTANLDPYNIGLIEEVVREINQTRSTTIVLVTHNIFQARRLAHRVGLMLAGKIIEIAPTADFFDHPKDPRTHAFVAGEMIY